MNCSEIYHHIHRRRLLLSISRKADRVNKPQFTISHITPKNIEELLKLMPSHKAAGSDGLGARIPKIAAPAISLTLSRLINHCIDTGTFPSTWKTAKVTPIYKGQGSKDDKNNFRPISVLPLLSKIFEKHVHQALHSYILAVHLAIRLPKILLDGNSAHSSDGSVAILLGQRSSKPVGLYLWITRKLST